VHSGSIQPFDYISFACILSVPNILLCCTSIKSESFPLPINQLIKLLSEYSLGIFCINGIVSQIFLSFGEKLFSQSSFNFLEILIIKVTGLIVLLFISLTISILLKNLGLKRVVC
ncbi:MAG: hypothetical protein AAF378_01220, partial [Cyanobacteria bacterium P01_A01_bin.84]